MFNLQVGSKREELRYLFVNGSGIDMFNSQVFATAFIGINISSSIVSFILIVGLVTLVTLPFTFELTWRVIWSYAGTILLTFVLPAVIKFLSTKILKGCIFGPTFIKTRAGDSPAVIA